MARKAPDLIICIIVFASVLVLFVFNKSLSFSGVLEEFSGHYVWIQHGILNCLGYCTIFLPGYLVFRYIRKINYLNTCDHGIIAKLVRKCFGEEELLTTNPSSGQTVTSRTSFQKAVLLMFYFCGLQISFLSWGVLQEKVMTQKYENENGEVAYFKDSQFLVLVNRVLAFIMSTAIILFKGYTRHRCPLYKYSFCSFSNIMSSWCQYEALKYVSFPHQVLAKAAKTIPVMIMGKVVSKTKYEFYEYVTAVILSIGMLFFMLDTGDEKKGSSVTTLSGVILLCSYILFDSFTSNWQGDLFHTYAMKPIQMMCYVNFYSCIFTSVSIIQQGQLLNSIDFMIKYPEFVVDCVLLSICSAGGQLFIFSTLSTFGPLVFAFISTIRQGFSVLISCLIYNHQIKLMGILGMILVFFSILLRIYCGHRLKSLRRNQLLSTKL